MLIMRLGDRSGSGPMNEVRKLKGMIRRGDVQVSLCGVGVTMAAVALYLADWGTVSKELVMIAWAGWALLPPAYFLWNWARFDGTVDQPEFEELKYSQELASKFWLAGVGVLSVLLFQAGALDRSEGEAAGDGKSKAAETQRH
jgi:hypothetical protein